MSADLDVRPVADRTSRAGGTGRRNRFRWLVAAAAAAVIAGVGGYALSGLGDSASQAPTARDGQTATTDDGAHADGPLAGVTTELTGQAPLGRCAPPDASFIAAGTQAFEGTVTSIEGDTVTLQTTDVFTGEVGETVQVTAPPDQFGALVQAVDFREGQTYLVSATDGMVSVCGTSGPATSDLRSLYDQAFVR
jgi:hypothetical protein